MPVPQLTGEGGGHPFSPHWLPLFFPFPVSMAGPHLCIQNDDRTCFLKDLIFYRHFLLISFLMAAPPRLPCVNKSGGRGGQIEWQQNREAKGDEGKGERRSLGKKKWRRDLCFTHWHNVAGRVTGDPGWMTTKALIKPHITTIVGS